MSRDVCAFTRERCKTPEACEASHCVYAPDFRPISEGRLTQVEQYRLAMSEKRGSGEVP